MISYHDGNDFCKQTELNCPISTLQHTRAWPYDLASFPGWGRLANKATYDLDPLLCSCFISRLSNKACCGGSEDKIIVSIYSWTCNHIYGEVFGETRACVPLWVVAQMSNPLRVGIALGTGLHDTRHSQKLDGRSNVSLQFPARFLHKHVRHVKVTSPSPQIQSACNRHVVIPGMFRSHDE